MWSLHGEGMTDTLNLDWAWMTTRRNRSTAVNTESFRIRISKCKEGMRITVREK